MSQNSGDARIPVTQNSGDTILFSFRLAGAAGETWTHAPTQALLQPPEKPRAPPRPTRPSDGGMIESREHGSYEAYGTVPVALTL